MIPAYNKKGCAAFFSRQESITGEKPTSFAKKIQPCLTRDSSPNPLSYKPKVIATILAGRHPGGSFRLMPRKYQTAFLRFVNDHLKTFTFNEGQKIFPECHWCYCELVSPAHIWTFEF
ncbi:uncharacterized protein TNCV_1752031 [Trichonephila clavipes]|nr:uncharacterized protein TNCV_1752031 [Trichonephila clavipes]